MLGFRVFFNLTISNFRIWKSKGHKGKVVVTKVKQRPYDDLCGRMGNKEERSFKDVDLADRALISNEPLLVAMVMDRRGS